MKQSYIRRLYACMKLLKADICVHIVKYKKQLTLVKCGSIPEWWREVLNQTIWTVILIYSSSTIIKIYIRKEFVILLEDYWKKMYEWTNIPLGPHCLERVWFLYYLCELDIILFGLFRFNAKNCQLPPLWKKLLVLRITTSSYMSCID